MSIMDSKKTGVANTGNTTFNGDDVNIPGKATASEFESSFVDNEAGLIWPQANTNFTPEEGTFGIVPESDGLKKIVNGIKSALDVGDSSGYTAVPSYSDSEGTVGQYSWDSSYFYICVAVDTWDRFPITRANWDNPTPVVVIPQLSSVTIDGADVAITYDVAVTQGVGYNDNLLNIDGTTMGNDVALTYVSGDGTTTHNYTSATPAVNGETITLDFIGGVDALESSTGGDLASFSGASVTNNTSGVTYLINQNFETPTTGYDNGETWVEYKQEGGGTIDPAYTTTVLAGTQSCNLISDTYKDVTITSPIFAASSSLSIKYMYRMSVAPTDTSDIFRIEDVNNVEVASISMAVTSNILSIVHGTTIEYGGAGDNVSIDTTYYFWIDITNSTGADDGTMDLYISTTDTKPATANVSMTTGDNTADMRYIVQKADRSMNVVIDAIEVQ